MQFPPFDEDSLRRDLKRLEPSRRVAFGAACCERLLPNYQLFQERTGWGDAHLLRRALDRIWRSVKENDLKDEAEQLRTECESAAPDSDEFESDETSYAQEAVFAICAVLDYISEGDLGRIIQAAVFCLDTVDCFVQESEQLDSTDPGREDRILCHPMMQAELRNQQADLRLLLTSRDERDIDTLERQWRGISNIRATN